jgi:hypothetical protein
MIIFLIIIIIKYEIKGIRIRISRVKIFVKIQNKFNIKSKLV